ncbi:hypothetical protein ABMA27_011709 [Loxostege sticticalis]|uniref:Uncharacterized protein n=1 Tax=Loxostege sticticalis TaxID=481309 RepID=A0ABR3IH87_LOXSC
MQRLVELINTTDDIELLVKLFTVLAVYLVSNDTFTYKSNIITNNNVYNKIYNVLSNGPSLKTARTLHFITALLYQNEETEGPSRAQTLVLYAQNMIRISGCLSLMCNMFTSCMLHQETWRALCQCLAESCRKSRENQSYCSHLVPMGVQKCIQGNVEAMEMLTSLIHNHEYNTQLFVEANGITIFSRRETLLNDTSMQLLSSLVQNSTPEMLAMIHETVFQNLSHITHVYGTQNGIGQWATIIWHNLNSRLKVTKGLDDRMDLNSDNDKELVHNESSVIDIGFLKPDDTAKLLQNVIREIHQYNTRNNAIRNIRQHSDNMKTTQQDNCNARVTSDMTFLKTHWSQNKGFDRKISTNKSIKPSDPNLNEMSFSFLEQPSRGPNIGYLKNSKGFGSHMNTITSSHNTICGQVETKTNDMTNLHISQRDSTLSGASVSDREDPPSLLEFKPIFVSTPKKVAGRSKLNHLSKSSPRFLSHGRQNTLKKVDKTFKNLRTPKESVNPRKDLNNRSMTSRLFHAINDSCTTFVKTVKNIFKSKKNNSVKDQSASSPAACTRNSMEPSCSYSFTDYMRRRDALLSNETVESRPNFGEVLETENIKSCKTCNDTVSLKYKVNNDHYLKETVTKLKLGINLYGCDFKKISKAMWPRDTYMTPEVLYNLYRKLILK